MTQARYIIEYSKDFYITWGQIEHWILGSETTLEPNKGAGSSKNALTPSYDSMLANMCR